MFVKFLKCVILFTIILQEQELLDSDDQKYEHLKEDLHVLIEVEAPKAEAHGRLAAGIAEVQKFLVPVSFQDFSFPKSLSFIIITNAELMCHIFTVHHRIPMTQFVKSRCESWPI